MAGGGFLLHWGPTGGEIYQAMGALSRPSVYSDDLEKNYKSIILSDYHLMEADMASGPGFFEALVLSVSARVMGMVTSRLGAEDDEDVATTTIILPSVYLKKALQLAKTISEGGCPKHLTCKELMNWAPKKNETYVS